MITHLPDAETSDVDPIELYIRGLEIDAAKAQDHWRTTQGQGDLEATLVAFETLQRGKLSVLGETCGECGGAGEIEDGVLPASMYSPEESKMMRCPTCKGRRVVLPDGERHQ